MGLTAPVELDKAADGGDPGTGTDADAVSSLFTGVEVLTASELRIARLAAERRTKPQIAEGSFITQRTVETPLRHVFQKLGIGGRDQLPP